MKFFSTYSHIFQTVFFFLLIGCSKEEVSEPTKAQDISEADALSREAKSGIQMLADGSKFSGEMEQGVPHGYGRKEFENGDALVNYVKQYALHKLSLSSPHKEKMEVEKQLDMI